MTTVDQRVAIIQSFAGTYLRRHDLIEEADELEADARAGTTARARVGMCRGSRTRPRRRPCVDA